ncbi:MAG: monofunctional biosynthetic peptidoglycan transglycosylase [Vicinamibacterales bacterium]
MVTRVGRIIGVGAVVLFGCLVYSWLTLPDVRSLRTLNPATTAFMQLREKEAAAAGRAPRVVHRWLPYGRISPELKKAVLVAEDAAFWDHDGVDFAELQASARVNWAKGQWLRGGSTITQQLAKNLYLSPSKNPYRKVVELLITRRLEADLSKTRIFELYLNSIEWGDGIWGAEAAAETYFGRAASDLTASQAALLAGAIINPRLYSPAHPKARLLRRQRIILARMGSPARSPGPAVSPAEDLRNDTNVPDEPEQPPAPAPEAGEPQ